MGLAAGTRFGPYEVAEPIGSGGMGEVYRATDANLKRDVAIKVLPKAFVDDADRLARFQREAEILASLNHPNIATIHGLEKADDQTVFVMELVEGPTLADKIKDGPIPPDEAMNIALQIVAALEAAHEKGIVHRDLKPANVKLKDDGTVKVLDFGISRPIDPSAISGGSPVMTTPAVTQTGVILGTAAYMSPEQARGKFVDERTDIWAFGCLLFEMLTGQPAFGGEDVMLTLARVLDRDTDLSSIPKTISPTVRHTIQLCLEKDPRNRIADIRDVRLALAGRFEPKLSGAAETPRPQPIWRRALTPIATLLVGGVTVGTAVWLITQPDTPLVTKFSHPLPDGILLSSIGTPSLAVSPAGDLIAFAADNTLYIRPIGELEARRIDETAGQVLGHLMFSPNGRFVAYLSNDNRLMKAEIGGGSPVPITDAPENPFGPTWTADDTIVYVQGTQVLQVPASGAQQPQLLFDAGSSVARPSILPGGEHLLLTRGSDIIAAALATGEVTELFPGELAQYVDTGHVVYWDAGNLLARTFDPSTLTAGGAVSVVDDVYRIGQGAAPQFAISASGTLAYLEALPTEGTSSSVLAIADLQGGITELGVPPRDYAFPSVSPDGSRVAVQVNEDESHSNIYVYDLSEQSELRRVTTAGDINVQPWWIDDQTIYFASNRDGGSSRIFERPVDRGTAVAVTESDDAADHENPMLAPDGRLAFNVAGSRTPDIWIKAPDAESEPLVDGDNPELGPVFSPNGDAFAYFEILGNGARIVVEPYPPDGSKTPVSEDEVPAAWPIWTRTDTGGVATLLYQEPLSGLVRAVDVTVPGLAFRNRRTVFQSAGAAFARNVASIPGTEQYVVVWNPEVGGLGSISAVIPDEIIVVENWTEVLKERVRVD